MEKCLDFFQGLVTSKQQFSFKLSLAKDTFNFNNKELVNSSCVKKKKLPCQTRREERRKIERDQTVTKDATVKVTEVPDSTNFKCEQCDMHFGSDKSLKVHIGKAHKPVIASTPEKKRSESVMEEPTLALTPTHGIREEASEEAAEVNEHVSVELPNIDMNKVIDKDCFNVLAITQKCVIGCNKKLSTKEECYKHMYLSHSQCCKKNSNLKKSDFEDKIKKDGIQKSVLNHTLS